ncbi:permease prefix domain 1-containing protein [Peribacillus frigoritolerans]|uniref:permease prefix domain 1-containing protein n=1 Tax=Peribacillus frigoritolerans TaxID=450367 RepID=UPI003F8399CB
MKQIEVFVDSVYLNATGNRKEIKELKAEMKNHLLEAVYELKSEGKSEQEAIEIAIERFGGENEIRSVVSQLFQAQKTFAKRVLYIAFTFLLLGIIGFLSLGLFEYQHYKNVENIGNEILRSLGTQTTISNDTKEIMTASVEDNKFIYGVKVTSNISNSDFEFFEETNPILNHFNTGFNNKESDWSVEMEISNFDRLTYGLLSIGLVVYWVLFTIWATINAYHHRRLNIGWIIVFAIFNVLGYLVYYLIGKKDHSNTIS